MKRKRPQLDPAATAQRSAYFASIRAEERKARRGDGVMGHDPKRDRHLTPRETAALSEPIRPVATAQVPELTNAELRAKHTCMDARSGGTSMTCRACNRGVPYPHETIEEIEARLRGTPAPSSDLTDAQLATIGLVDLRVAYRQLRDRHNARAKGAK